MFFYMINLFSSDFFLHLINFHVFLHDTFIFIWFPHMIHLFLHDFYMIQYFPFFSTQFSNAISHVLETSSE